MTLDESTPTESSRVLSIVVPVWNEVDTLPRTIPAITRELDRLIATGMIVGWEVVLVDDASTDGSGDLIDSIASRESRVVGIHHHRNAKLGRSIRSGFAAATGDLVMYTDADLPFDPAEIHRALHLMDLYGADLVAAYRLQRKGEGPLRFLYSYVYNFAINMALGLRIRDVNFSAKLLTRQLLESMELKSEGSLIDVELLARARNNGAHIIQFGVDYFPRTRGVSTLSSPGVILTMLRELVVLGAELRRRPSS